jgi:hypothetical protein
MISSSKTNRVDVHEFRKNVYDICEELSEKIINYERKNKLRRTKKFSTGFPLAVNSVELKQGLAEKRFKDKYAVSIRKKHGGAYHLEGVLAALGLITVMRSNDKKHYVSMTDAGKKFYLLDNPILKGDYSSVFSDDEINYIIEKLIPERELEDKLVKRVLESVKNFDGKDKIAIKLNEDFLQEFNDFVKSYDHKEHKARLVKDFIDKGIPQIDKGEAVPPIIACRVATMGRLSELKLVEWSIDKNGWSEYELTAKGEEYLSSV